MIRIRLAIPLFVLGLFFLFPATAGADPGFRDYLDGIAEEAREAGVSESTLVILEDLEPDPEVIERDRHQPEGTMTFKRYQEIILSERRIAEGAERLRENESLLANLQQEYGVDPAILIALWGVESNFGSNTGSFEVIRSLATLAHDGRREALFRRELLAALQILDEGHVGAEEMLGSWAGAMGQSQFLPSSFLNFAVDHTGDGRKDIWSSTEDTLASAANYLARNGWIAGEAWGRRLALLPAGRDAADITVEDLPSLGVRGLTDPRLVRPGEGIDAGDGPLYAVGANYDVLRSWNRSHFFAASVGDLAESIRQRTGR